MPARLTRTAHFSSAHHYSRPEWSEEANRAAFGESRFQHGHNFTLDVTVEGPIDDQTGFIVDLMALDRSIRGVVAPLRQRDLTEVVPAFAPGTGIPSTESLARWFWRELVGEIVPPARLVRIGVRESGDLSSEYSEP